MFLLTASCEHLLFAEFNEFQKDQLMRPPSSLTRLSLIVPLIHHLQVDGNENIRF